MCQGKKTYGRRQSETLSGVHPGNVPPVMEDISHTWTLQYLSVNVGCWCVCVFCAQDG